MSDLSQCMPYCMMPDGAEPCKGYSAALAEIERLTAECHKYRSLYEAESSEVQLVNIEIERQAKRIAELEKGYVQLQKFVDAQAEDAALWGYALYISEAYIQRGLRGCHAFIEQTIEALEGEQNE